MKVRLPLMVQDPATSHLNNIRTTETFYAYGDDFYDGPVTERFAVLDLDPQSGELLPGVKFVPSGKTMAHFDVPRRPSTGKQSGEYDIESAAFKQAAVLSMALRTLFLFERNQQTDYDILGRRVKWAFNAPQLFLVPRAGISANAYYERASHSIQFFSFPSRCEPGQTIHTCLSRDIVAHETTHAILDAIAPELYDAITPQSLAIHEALADLGAAFMSFESGNVANAVLKETRGEIEDTTAFSSIAEEFGRARDASGQTQYLRSLYNTRALSDLVEESPAPHDLSLVLSGALYSLLVRLYKDLVRPEIAKKYHYKPAPSFSASGEALAVSSAVLRRMIFGALDYLPPGDATFADLGRAIIAADKPMHSDTRSAQVRRWLKEEFARRGIVAQQDDLERGQDDPQTKLDLEVEALLQSDWVAYTFAEQNRALLRIPAGITYKIWPRYLANRRHASTHGVVEAQECIFKVSWTEEEDNEHAPLPRRRRVTAGTTLVIDAGRQPPRVRAVLTSEHGAAQQQARSAYLRRLHESGTLRLDDRPGPHEEFPHMFIIGETGSGLLRVRGTARMLHIVE